MKRKERRKEGLKKGNGEEKNERIEKGKDRRMGKTRKESRAAKEGNGKERETEEGRKVVLPAGALLSEQQRLRV